MEVIAFHMNEKTVVVTVTTRKNARISLLSVFLERAVGGGRGAANQTNTPPPPPPVRNRQNYIWSQTIRPPVNNQFLGNPGLSVLVDTQDNAIKMGFVVCTRQNASRLTIQTNSTMIKNKILINNTESFR